MVSSLERTEYYYSSDNVLQNVAVWQFPRNQVEAATPQGSKKYWLMYVIQDHFSSTRTFPKLTNKNSFIHGGAWRDPRESLSAVEPTLEALLSPDSPHRLPNAAARIAGFASLNYRLSAYPEAFAQAPCHTPSFALRAARHPDHLVDALSGLRFLQRHFAFGDDYVLVGHSAGAFLSYQVLVREAFLGKGQFADVVSPVAVVGLEGIYDLRGLNRRKGGSYTGFMKAAFGPDDDGAWDAASPATTKAGSNYKKDWAGKDQGTRKLAVLVHAEDDELVDMAECDAMESRLRQDGVEQIMLVKDLTGGHFGALKKGEIARVLRDVWSKLE